MTEFIFALVIAFISYIYAFMRIYTTYKYDKWVIECYENIVYRKGGILEACYDRCPPGHYFIVYRFSSEFHYPFPTWTMYFNFKTYCPCPPRYERVELVASGEIFPIPIP